MLTFTKILCPSDFSEASQAAVDAAADIAVQFHAALHLVHIVPVVPQVAPNPNFVLAVPEYERALHAEGDRQLKALAGCLAGRNLVVRTSVGHGDAGHEIVRIANEEGVDLIVIGTHGHTGWQHVMFGSVAEKVVRLARRPVLTIPAVKQ